jgi:hypothetical protein
LQSWTTSYAFAAPRESDSCGNCRSAQGKVKNQEVAITGLLDDVCDQSNMKRFKFIPPKMVLHLGPAERSPLLPLCFVGFLSRFLIDGGAARPQVKGCQGFMDEYDGEFEKPLFEVDLSTIEALTRETRDNRPGLNALQDKVCAQTVSVCKGVTVNPPRCAQLRQLTTLRVWSFPRMFATFAAADTCLVGIGNCSP